MCEENIYHEGNDGYDYLWFLFATLYLSFYAFQKLNRGTKEGFPCHDMDLLYIPHIEI